MWRSGLQACRFSRVLQNIHRTAPLSTRGYCISHTLRGSPKAKDTSDNGYLQGPRYDQSSSLSNEGKFSHLRYQDIVRAIQDADRDFLRHKLPSGLEVPEAREQMDEKLVELQMRDLYMEEYKKDMNKKFLRAFPLGITIGPFSSRRQTKNGKVITFRTIVVAGNGKGFGAFGFGRGPTDEAATNNAVRDLWNHTIYLPLSESRTFPHPVVGKYSKTEVLMRPSRRGHLITANPMVTEIMKIFGIQDATAKLIGNRNPLSVVKAMFNGVSKLRSIEESAKARGKVVFRSIDELDMREKMPLQRDLDKKTEEVADLMREAMKKSIFMRYNMRVSDEQRAVEDFKKKSEKEIFYLVTGKKKPESSVEDPMKELEPKLSQLEDIMRGILTKIRMGFISNVAELELNVRGMVHQWAASNLFNVPEEELMEPIRAVAAKHSKTNLGQKDQLEGMVKDMLRAVSERVNPLGPQTPLSSSPFQLDPMDNNSVHLNKALLYPSLKYGGDRDGDFRIVTDEKLVNYPFDMMMEGIDLSDAQPEYDDTLEDVVDPVEHDEQVDAQPQILDLFRNMMKEGELSAQQIAKLDLSSVQKAGMDDLTKLMRDVKTQTISKDEVLQVADAMKELGFNIDGDVKQYLDTLKSPNFTLDAISRLGEELEESGKQQVMDDFLMRFDPVAWRQHVLDLNESEVPTMIGDKFLEQAKELRKKYGVDGDIEEEVRILEAEDRAREEEEVSEGEEEGSEGEKVESEEEVDDLMEEEEVDGEEEDGPYLMRPMMKYPTQPVETRPEFQTESFLAGEEELKNILEGVDEEALQKAKEALDKSGITSAMTPGIADEMSKMMRDMGTSFVPKEDMAIFEEELKRFEQDPESYLQNVMSNFDSNLELLKSGAMQHAEQAVEDVEVEAEGEAEAEAEAEENAEENK